MLFCSCYCDLVQTASAYVLFYRRRTEGRPVRRNILDRSLSQSFADEHKKLKEKYAALEEEEEGEKERVQTRDEKMEQDNQQSNSRTRNEVKYYAKINIVLCRLLSVVDKMDHN